MIRKYHNHNPQTTQWHHEEEPLNHHETPARQIKQNNQLSLPHQNGCHTRMDIKLSTTKHTTNYRLPQWELQKTKKNNPTTTEPPPKNGQQPKHPGGLNAFYWYQIFALDSAVVEVQEMFSSHGGLLTNAMSHHGEHSYQLNTP